MNSYIENYLRWINSDKIDQSIKDELQNLSEEEKKKLFSKYVSFGTGGIRSKMGVGTNRLNIYTVRKCAEGYAKWLLNQYGKRNIEIVIAYDNRRNSIEFAKEIISVLSKHKIYTKTFDSLRPTPELSFAIRELNADGGVVITASHNTKEYNGIKMYDETGCQCTDEITREIKKQIDLTESEFDIALSKEEINQYASTIDTKIDYRYIEETLDIISNNQLDYSKLKVLYTPQHGTGNIPVTKALQEMKCDLYKVEEQSFPNEDFCNTLTPNPEMLESFSCALKLSEKIRPDIIIGTDPDCDRIGVMVRNNGDYTMLTGNQIGVIMLEYIIENSKQDNPIVYNSIVSTSLANKICNTNNIQLVSTLTGFKNIGKQINDLEKKENFLFAFEESNGYLIKEIVRDKDGVQAAVKVCEIATFCKEKGITIIDYLDDIYKCYGKFDEGQDAIRLDDKEDGYVDKVMSKIRNLDTSIANYNIRKIEDYYYSKIKENGEVRELNFAKSNVVKIYFDDYTWIAIRPSGTEPKIKIYYCIEREKKDIDKFNKIRKSITSIIKGD